MRPHDRTFASNCAVVGARAPRERRSWTCAPCRSLRFVPRGTSQYDAPSWLNVDALIRESNDDALAAMMLHWLERMFFFFLLCGALLARLARLTWPLLPSHRQSWARSCAGTASSGSSGAAPLLARAKEVRKNRRHSERAHSAAIVFILPTRTWHDAVQRAHWIIHAHGGRARHVAYECGGDSCLVSSRNDCNWLHCGGACALRSPG